MIDISSKNQNADHELCLQRVNIRANDEFEQNFAIVMAQLTAKFQVLIDIQNVRPNMLISIFHDIEYNKKYCKLIAEHFPYDLYFTLLTQSHNERVKVLALKNLSFFSNFPSFPFESYKVLLLVDILPNCNKESTLSPILNIATNMLVTFPKLRDDYLNFGILNFLRQFPISHKIPRLLEVMLMSTVPVPPPEIISQIVEIYIILIQKYVSENRNELLIASYALSSVGQILKTGIVFFDYSIFLQFLDGLLSKSHEEIIICPTITIITYLPFQTIQFAKRCIDCMIGIKNFNVIHRLLVLFIKKHEEWNGPFDEQLIELCLFYSSTDDIDFKDGLKVLEVMLLYFPFNQIYDGRMVDVLIKFLTFPKTTKVCLLKLMEIMNAEFEENEKQEFESKIEEYSDDFQSLIDESDDDVSQLASNFIQMFDSWKSQSS